jgi:hypothetical protein
MLYPSMSCGWAACGRLLPLWTPHAIRLCVKDWVEDGIFWALKYIQKRLVTIYEEFQQSKYQRKRSSSLPNPDLNLSLEFGLCDSDLSPGDGSESISYICATNRRASIGVNLTDKYIGLKSPKERKRMSDVLARFENKAKTIKYKSSIRRKDKKEKAVQDAHSLLSAAPDLLTDSDCETGDARRRGALPGADGSSGTLNVSSR